MIKISNPKSALVFELLKIHVDKKVLEMVKN